VSNSKARPEDDAERLFLEYRATRDTPIRDRLVLMHENLVRFLAAKFANRGEPLEDLVQVGTIGLINAIDRFEPERGTKFSTYATPTIVGEIKRHFRDRAWNLKVPRWLQELNLQVMRANEQLAQQLGRSPTIVEIAAHVGASEAETLDAMELGNAYETVSLDTKLSASSSKEMSSTGQRSRLKPNCRSKRPVMSPWRRIRSTSPLSRNCCAFGGSLPIKRRRETRPPS